MHDVYLISLTRGSHLTVQMCLHEKKFKLKLLNSYLRHIVCKLQSTVVPKSRYAQCINVRDIFA